jgi:hypothetical protein
LESRKRAGEHRLHQSEGSVAEAEFALPDRQQDVDRVGKSIVQHMRAAGDRNRAVFVLAAHVGCYGRARVGQSGHVGSNTPVRGVNQPELARISEVRGIIKKGRFFRSGLCRKIIRRLVVMAVMPRPAVMMAARPAVVPMPPAVVAVVSVTASRKVLCGRSRLSLRGFGLHRSCGGGLSKSGSDEQNARCGCCNH